jgi:hypothetical protein
MKVEINDWKQLFKISANHSPLTISLPTIALANPPYCKINSISDSELSRFEMAYKWKEQENGSYVITSKLRNQIDQECLFVEQCLKQLQPGEIVCVLLSNADRGTRSRKSLCSRRYRMWDKKKISNI